VTLENRANEKDRDEQLSSQRLYLLPSISQAKSFIIIAVWEEIEVKGRKSVEGGGGNSLGKMVVCVCVCVCVLER
jgi:hypothetical protein